MYSRTSIFAVVLVLAFFALTSSVPAQGSKDPSCCAGFRGNIQLFPDCMPGDEAVDIADLTNLIDHLFVTYPVLCCMYEADLAPYGAPDGSIDIADLTWLIDHLFINYPVLPTCDNVGSPSGSLVDMTDCKTFTRDPVNETPPYMDCIFYEYDVSGVLTLKHVNAQFNCCPTIAPEISLEGNTITIDEIELEGVCDCNCLFDLDYEIIDLPPGVYRIVVIEPYLPQGEEMLDFYINLITTPSGEYCLDRSHLPWWGY